MRDSRLCRLFFFSFFSPQNKQNSAPIEKKRGLFGIAPLQATCGAGKSTRHRICALNLSRCGAGFWPMLFFLETERKGKTGQGVQPADRAPEQACAPAHENKNAPIRRDPLFSFFSGLLRLTDGQRVCAGRVLLFVCTGRTNLARQENLYFSLVSRRLPFFPCVCRRVCVVPISRIGLMQVATKKKRQMFVFF